MPQVSRPDRDAATRRAELERRVSQGLADWQRRHPDGRFRPDGKLDESEKALVSDIYELLYGELRGLAYSMPELGWRANDPRADFSVRFTSALNKAFERILNDCPDRLLQGTRNNLRSFVAQAMAWAMLDHYRKKGIGRRIVETFLGPQEEAEQSAAVLARLAQEKQSYFESRGFPMSFERALETWEGWLSSDDADEQQYGLVLLLRYVMGYGYDQIGEILNLGRTDVENLLERAKYHLRKGKA